MDYQKLRILTFILFFSGGVQAAPLEAYGRLPLYEDVALSPDGSHAAFVTTIGNERQVVIQNLAKPSDSVRLRAGDHKLRRLVWAGPEHVLITTSQTNVYMFGPPSSEAFAVQVYDLQRRDVYAPMMLVEDAWNLVYGQPQVRMLEGKPYVYLEGVAKEASSYYGVPVLFRLDLQKKALLGIETIKYNQQLERVQWLVDEAGKPVVRSDYDEHSKRWLLSLNRDGKWQDLLSEVAPIDYPHVVGFGPESGAVAVSKISAGGATLRRLSLQDGAWGSEVLPPEKTGQDYLEDPLTHRLIASMRLDVLRHYYFLSDEDQQRWNQVLQSFPKEELEIISWSDDRKKMIVRAFGPKTGAGYVLVDLEKKQTAYLGDYYKEISAADIAPVIPIHYPAADGLDITGYLTLPKDRPRQNLPLVVLPHGGPAARDIYGFDWWPQALASHGYAVLQPNYRGSDGLGVKFQEAGYGEYGRKMQTDLSDGVRFLASKNVIDPKRVCIVGASYGGYAALAGATLDVGVYRCAVSIAGLADLKQFLARKYEHREVKDDNEMRYRNRYMGTSGMEDPHLSEISPALHVDKVSIPILLIHGSDDVVVPFEQSEIMADALKRAGKPYQFVKLKGEDHWLSRSETRTQMLTETVKFLEQNNPP